MTASIWTILTAIAPILAPVVSLALIVAGRIIWNHEKRLRSNEQSIVRHGRTLYGDDHDVQQTGLSQDIQSLIDRIERVEEKIDRLYEDEQNDN